MPNTSKYNMDLEPTVIDGEQYYTIKQFAYIVGRAEAQISMLMTRGNKARKLKSIRLGGKPFIVASEIMEFPFDSRLVPKDDNHVSL